MKISEINECLKRIREIYPYKDDATNMRISRNPQSNIDKLVEIETYDEEKGVMVNLSAEPRESFITGVKA
jgi:hypothetical protein